MTRLCVSLTENDTDGMLSAMRALPPEVRIAEVRLDMMASCDIPRLCLSRDREIIVTNRPVREGGSCAAPESERLTALRTAAEHGAEYVDVELDAVGALGELPAGVGRIVSYHNFRKTPADLPRVLRRILAAEPDVAKVAVKANDIADCAAVFDLIERQTAERPLIALCMGEEGLATRVLAGKLGAFLTFASRDEGAESAPGQVPVRDMLGMYRFPAIDAATEVYGVVANPVAHSMSPPIHNAAFAALGLNAVYLPLKVNNPRNFLDAFEPRDLRGLSVTIPHKEAMLELMDEVEELAARVGALNTVRIRDGRRYGCNTDVSAAMEAMTDAVQRAGRKELTDCDVLLVGAGGAGRAIAHGLAGRVAHLTIANRTVKRARQLAAELDAAWCPLDAISERRPDVLVNATAVGMWPKVDETPAPASMLRPGMVVFDSVYNPVRTRLLQEAEQAGAITASGFEWFVKQAAAQFTLWTDREAPREVMERVLRQRLAND